MKLHRVESEMLRKVGYDPDSETLWVIFNSGETYHYLNVPPSEYKRLMEAESHGQYMHQHIIGKYDYERIA